MKTSGLIIFKLLFKIILRNFLIISLLLSIVILGNQFFLVLSQSLSQGFYNSEILPMILLKFLRDFPFILNLGLLISLTFSLNKLYKTSEFTILHSIGIGEKKIFQLIFPSVFLVMLLSTSMSFSIVPEIKQKIANMKLNAEARPEYIFFQKGTFNNFNNNNFTIYIDDIDYPEKDVELLKNIFIFSQDQDKLILAREGAKKIYLDEENVALTLKNGKIYEYLSSEDADRITEFKTYDFFITNKNTVNNEVSINSEKKGILELFVSQDNKDYPELLYRLSLPISLIILSFFAVLVSKTNPRDSRNLSTGYILIGFLAYYNSLATIRTTVENDLTQLYLFLTPHIFFLIISGLIYFYRNNLNIKI